MNTNLFARRLTVSFALLTAVGTKTAFAGDLPRVIFVTPKNGAEVSSPVSVTMGVEGMKAVPLGEVKTGEGHHHLIIDGAAIKEGEIVPADAIHLHFGKAQTEASVPLTPGKHRLTLQFADGVHRSFGEQMSSTIEITVK